jgi:hypothetical protein
LNNGSGAVLVRHTGDVTSAATSRRPAALAGALGAGCVLVPAWVAGTRWSTLAAGHPAHPVLLGALAALGVVLLVRARCARPGGTWRAIRRAAAGLVVVALLAVAAWLRPYAAEPVAVAATAPSAAVDVVDGWTTWELRPRGRPSGVGVVFFPGALVDPRAYLALLRPLAERGHPVVVLKPPLGVALLASAGPVLDARPGVARWVLGGHSLGGVAAADGAVDAGRRAAGVFFWASYPAADLAGAPLSAASVSGDRDTLSTPADVAASRERLPPDTEFTVVPGAVHAFFGDYGPQTGDGVPATTRAEAQRRIVEATQRFVASIAARPPHGAG